MSRTETELEFLKQKVVDIERQTRQFTETQKDSLTTLKSLEKTHSEQEA